MAIKNGTFHRNEIIPVTKVPAVRTAVDPAKRDLSNRISPVISAYSRVRIVLSQNKGQVRSTYLAGRTIGKIVTIADNEKGMVFRVSSGGIPTVRTNKPHTSFMGESAVKGTKLVRTLQGTGAYGAGNTGSTPPTPEPQPIRRYPRDWHGDNMQ